MIFFFKFEIKEYKFKTLPETRPPRMLLHMLARSLAAVSVFTFFGLCLLMVCLLCHIVFGNSFKFYYQLVRTSLKY